MAGNKLATYQTDRGPRAGIVVGDAIHDAATSTGDPGYAAMQSILEEWDVASAKLDRAAADAGTQGLPLAQARLRAPLLRPGVIYCAGSNYRDHSEEMRKLHNRPAEPDPHALGLKPWQFIKASTCVSDPDATISITGYSKTVDYEAELAAVIGRPGRKLTVESALDAVAGYTIGNDLSARDMGRRAKTPDTSPFSADWVAHKSFEGACPLGPWIVPAADIADPMDLDMKLWVNDVLKQDSNTGQMIFSLAEQIAHVSERITVQPGDVFMTGTPAGVGAARQEFLKPGDVVRIWIEGIGTLVSRFA